MKFYYVYTTTYHNDTRIGTCISKILVNEVPKAKTTILTWDNLEENYRKNGLLYKFNIWNCKKGRRVSFFLDTLFCEKDVKEWKEELNIRIETTYKEFSPCIADVLKWHDIENAIAYLNERGLKII